MMHGQKNIKLFPDLKDSWNFPFSLKYKHDM